MEHICLDYGRVSTTAFSQDSSISEQTAIDENSYAYKWASENGLTLKPQYVFSDRKTGTKMDRNGMNTMLELIGIHVSKIKDPNALMKNGNYDKRKTRQQVVYFPDADKIEKARTELGIEYIVCKNTSRWTRCADVKILEILYQHQIYVHFLDQNLDTKKDGISDILRIIQILDRSFSAGQSEKMKTGFEQSYKRNHIRNNMLYGYDYIPKGTGTCGYLKINKKEAKVVRHIFDLFCNQNYGVRKICKQLRMENIKTRKRITKDGKKIGGGYFGTTTIKNILSNSKYAGLNNTSKKWDTGEVFNKKSPQKIYDYTCMPNENIEPIISAEMFYKAQSITKEKANKGNHRGVYKGSAKYTGLIRCGLCGSQYISNGDINSAGVYIRKYNCSLKRKNGIKACNNINLPETEVVKCFDKLKNNFILIYRKNIELLITLWIELLIDIIYQYNTSDATAVYNEKHALYIKKYENYKKMMERALLSDNNNEFLTQILKDNEYELKQLKDECDRCEKYNASLKNLLHYTTKQIISLNLFNKKDEFTEEEIFSFKPTLVIMPEKHYFMKLEYINEKKDEIKTEYKNLSTLIYGTDKNVNEVKLIPDNFYSDVVRFKAALNKRYEVLRSGAEWCDIDVKQIADIYKNVVNTRVNNAITIDNITFY